MPIAYLVGGYLSADITKQMLAGDYPKCEYNVFLQRHPAECLSYAEVQGSRKIISKWAVSRNMLHTGMASVMLSQHQSYDAVIASGEDVGIPLAIHCNMVGYKKPLYIITHGSYFGSKKFRLLMKGMRLFSNVSYLCLSSSLSDYMIKEFRVHPENVHNTGYGIDIDFFKPMNLESKRIIIASAGSANRDYETLLHSVANLDVDIKIAADSAWFPYEPRISKETLPENVEIRSYGNYPALKELYSKSQMVVVPLHQAYHACGYAVIGEAMAMGKPVIATRTLNNSDFIVDGETGYYVSPGNSKELRAKIQHLIDYPNIAAEMGKNGRERIEKLFSLDSYINRMEAAMKLH